MSLSVVYTRANIGIDAPLVTIEVHLSNGLPAFQLVGLPETSVKESRDRVKSALINAGFEFPSKRITVNMAPADLPKGGGRFDLAIAIGIIAASEEIPLVQLEHYEFVGELALSGALRPIQGALPMAHAAKKSKRQLVLPAQNAQEAALVKDAGVLSAKNVFDVYLHLIGKQSLDEAEITKQASSHTDYGDMSDIIEQHHAKRALEICASGGHNLLLFGPAGTGKSMLANRLLSILPDLCEEDALTVASIRSIAGETIHAGNWKRRPFRQPHHSSSAAALVGGGSYPKPGEITLAHKGVLFLDELPEFGRHVLDVMREPLETGEINLSRASQKITYPADFQLIAAMNPSPTGDVEDKRANADQIMRYLNKVSGPLLDRIDLQVNVPRVNLQKTLSQMHNDDSAETQRTSSKAESSQIIKKRVQHAQDLQFNRQGCLNASLSNAQIKEVCRLKANDHLFITQAIDALGLSMRAYHRTLKVSRSIADLDMSTNIKQCHIAEALSYRSFDRLLHQLISQ
uniref:YifB family Mg chelatase-like AAA ATPase n=1 Tax=Ningiella ruwaisensis TaxID=2364274 RepID=UPI00109FB5A3|nr:YifB family Mg chelatase-like AAA ATPase [Ningiella ruwaisensis]